MRDKRYISLLLITALLLTAAVSCGKPNLPEQSSFTSPEAGKTTAPPLNQTDGLTKPPDTAANTYEYTAYNPFPFTEPDPALIINRQKELLKLIKNKTPYNDLITKTVDIYEFVQTFSPLPGVPVFWPSLAAIDEEIGVECLRRNKAGNYYSVHKLKQGGLLYIFYIKEKSLNYLWMLNWFVVQKSLSYEDFSAISKGSSYEDVEAVDPAADIYEQRRLSGFEKTSKQSPLDLVTRHYLTDGILTIYYEFVDGKLVVHYLEYRKNFQVDVLGASSYPSYNGRILDIDAIQ